MEDELFTDNFLYDFCNRSDTDDSRQDEETSNGEGNKKQKIYQGSKNERLKQFILKFPCSPLYMIFNLPQWIHGPYKFLSKRSPKIETIMHIIRLGFCDMSTSDFYNYFSF